MRKNVIALLLAIVMVSGSVGSAPSLAAETTVQESVDVEEETAIETDGVSEETVDTGKSETVEDVSEGEPADEKDAGIVLDSMETVDKSETDPTEETEVAEDAGEEDVAGIADTSAEVAEIEEPSVADEEESIEIEEKKPSLAAANDVASGDCGESATWTLTGTKDNLTLTISGSGKMDDFEQESSPWGQYANIKTAIIEDGIENIGSYSFYGAVNLQSVTIPESVTSIGKYAFYNCNALKSITIPNGVTSIGAEAFSFPDWQRQNRKININDLNSWLNIEVLFKTGLSGDLYLNGELLTSIVIPDGITSIRMEAFNGNSKLQSITIPDGVTRIDHYAFKGCSNLKSIEIPEGVTSIGFGAFESCSSLQSVNIPEGVTVIADASFSGCISLQSITIPESVEKLGANAFSNCTSLRQVTMPNGLKVIEDNAFYYCISLKSITIPESVRRIGSFAFEGYEGDPREIHISNLNAWLNIYAPESRLFGELYLNDELLTSVVIPEWITSIRADAFSGCRRLKSITIPDSVTSIEDYAFFICRSLKSITLPKRLISIGECSFEGCSNLSGITIPETVRSIEGYAFSGCRKLIAITIPTNVTHVGGCLLGEHSNTSIRYRGTKEQWKTITENANIPCKSIAYNYFSVDADFKLSGTLFDFNGKEIRPTVTVAYNGQELVEGTDYELVYKNNKNAGTGSVDINGIGRYSGTATETFTINKLPNTISAKNFTKTYSAITQSFDLGAKIKNGTPTYKSSTKSVTVSKAGKVTVKAKFIGKATITITSPEKTNYSKQTKKITITVNPTKTALSSVTSPSAGKITVKWKKNAVGNGYLFQYSTTSTFKNAKTVWITNNATVSRTISGLAKGKKYYVHIRTYKKVGNAKYYSGWSAAKAVTVKK